MGITMSQTMRPDPATLDLFAKELDGIREQTMEKVGQVDADYIRNIVRLQRGSEITGRVTMVLGFLNPVLWVLGVLLLAVAKILDNMEIGHNVKHGQYDWMNDPNLNSRQFEWDHAGDSNSWKRYHNYEHHTYTNILGKDRDFGYGLLRLSDDTRWKPKNRWQVPIFVVFSMMFQWGVAYHELAGERIFFGKRKRTSALPISRKALRNAFFSKGARQLFKDYVFFPLLYWPMFLPVVLGNFCANMLRDLWTASVIFCGHFTEDIKVFKMSKCKDESQGQWYYRQILGSSNFTGPRWMHILTGHLSCQIEHHLFPDVPAWRYLQISKQVQAVCKKYDIPYNTGSFATQYFGVLKRVYTFSLAPKAKAA
jgi:fatty acid desaturase